MQQRSAALLAALVTVLIAMCISWAVHPLFAGASQGKDLFEKHCTGCHSLDHDQTGPRLRGVFGRPAGSIPSFPYSESLRNAHVVWNESSLDKWLTDPDALIPDNDMAFRVANNHERATLIEYLKQVSEK